MRIKLIIKDIYITLSRFAVSMMHKHKNYSLTIHTLLLLIPLFTVGSFLDAGFVQAQPPGIATTVSGGKELQRVELNEEERSWLKLHPIIRFSGDPAYLPLEAFSADGKYIGIFSEILGLLESRLDVRFERVPVSTWSEAVRMAESGKVDFLSESITSGRDKLFTNPHSEIPVVIIGRKGTPTLSSPAELNGRKVAVVKGYTVHTPFREANPGIDFVEVESTSSGLLMVTSGKVDSFMSTPLTASYLMSKMGLEDLNIIGYTGAIIKLGFGVRKDAPHLVSILNKALSTITEPEKFAFRVKWSADRFERFSVKLTFKEQAWLKNHPKIYIGLPEGLAPYVMDDNEGNQVGILVDFLDELNRTLGSNIILKTMPSSKIFEMSKNKEIDVIYALEPEKAKAENLMATDVWAIGYPAIYARKGSSFKAPDDLAGKKIVLRPNTIWDNELVKTYASMENVVYAETPLDAMKMVLNEEADLYIGLTSHTHALTKYRLFGISQAYVFENKKLPFAMGIRSDWPELVSILNKGLSAIGRKGLRKIVQKWISADKKEYTVSIPNKALLFTPEELQWLDKKEPLTYVYDPDWAPFEWTNAIREHTGIISDILKIISDKTGIVFLPVHTKSWTDSVKLAKTDKVDMYSAVAITEDRSKYVNFTSNSIYSYGGVFVSGIDNKDVIPKGHSNFSAKKIAIIDGNKLSEIVKKNHPEANYIFVDSPRVGLNKVKTKEADLFAVNGATAAYYINHRGFSDLKIYKKIDFTFELKIALQKRLPKEVISILDKTLGSIDEQQLSDIFGKWTSVSIHKETDWSLVWKWTGGASGFLILIIFWTTLSNRQKLSKANKELHAEILVRKDTETTLRKSEERFRATFEQAAVGIAHVSPEGRFLRINRKFCEIVGYSIDEMRNLTFQDITYPDDLEADIGHVESLLRGDAETYAMDKRYVRKDKEIVWANLTVSLLHDDSGRPHYFVAVIKDISVQKLADQKLQAYKQRLKLLVSKLTVAEERERRTIAADLHDHVGHSLALARMQLKGILEATSDVEKNMLVNDISKILLEASQDTRSLIFELSSPSMNEIGLSAAISDWLDTQIAKRHGVEIEFSDTIADDCKKKLGVDERALLFRSVRELVTNVIKHARAQKMCVRLSSENSFVKIEIEDDGIGFDVEDIKTKDNKTGGFGLFSIEERMADLAGSCVVESKPGTGCRVVLTVPVETGGIESSPVKLKRRKDD